MICFSLSSDMANPAIINGIIKFINVTGLKTSPLKAINPITARNAKKSWRNVYLMQFNLFFKRKKQIKDNEPNWNNIFN